MRRVDVTLQVRVILDVDEGVEISHVVEELDYQFRDTTTKATVIDTEILDSQVNDSR